MNDLDERHDEGDPKLLPWGWYSTREVCQFLDCRRDWLYSLVQRKILKPRILRTPDMPASAGPNSRRYRYHSEDINALLVEHEEFQEQRQKEETTDGGISEGETSTEVR